MNQIMLSDVTKMIPTDSLENSLSVVDSAFPSQLNNLTILPGFCDVHVHLREPGFSYKETIKSGTLAAAAGGFTAVCSMPNVKPVPDSVENLNKQLKIIENDAVINVYPYAAITVGQKGETLSDMRVLSKKAVAFSDDGRGVQQEKMMRAAMQNAKELNKVIAAHCEVNELVNGGYIHDGEYAKAHGHRGICSESEYLQIERDLKLVKEIGCAYHVCHISTKEGVELIRRAKKEGLDVTCETAPHYLVMDDSFLQENGRFKMNPPLRSSEDRKALIEGICDGTIDMIATDHAPHSNEEKSKGLEDSAFGIVGLETAFAACYTHLVKNGIITLEKLVELMAINSRKRFNIPFTADLSVWDLSVEYIVDSKSFISMGKATVFDGEKLFGKCLMTICNGKIVYNTTSK